MCLIRQGSCTAAAVGHEGGLSCGFPAVRRRCLPQLSCTESGGGQGTLQRDDMLVEGQARDIWRGLGEKRGDR
jgi:hypothetical protein